MNISPWKDADSAFEIMFDENVSVTEPDGKKTSLKAAVFTDGMGDPLSEDMLDTEREDVTFVFSQKDWPFIQSIKRGATIMRCMYGKQYAVSKALLDNCLGWCITAREK